MRARTRMHIDAHTVRDVQKEHAKSASPRRTRILFPLLLPYSPTNSLPFPTNAQIKNARPPVFLRIAFLGGTGGEGGRGKERKKRKEKSEKPFLSTSTKHLFNLRLPCPPVNSLPLSSRGTSERKRKSARVESSMRHTGRLRPLRRSLTSKSRRTIQTNSVSLRSGFSLAVVSEHVRFLEDIPPYLYGPLISCLSPVVVDGGDGPAGTLAQVWRHESVTKSRAPVDGTTSLLSISLSVYGYFLSEVWRVPWPGRGKERERERVQATWEPLRNPPGLGRCAKEELIMPASQPR